MVMEQMDQAIERLSTNFNDAQEDELDCLTEDRQSLQEWVHDLWTEEPALQHADWEFAIRDAAAETERFVASNRVP